MNQIYSETRQQKQSQTNLQTLSNDELQQNYPVKNDRINQFPVLGIDKQTLTKNPTQLPSNNHQASNHQTNSPNNSNAIQSLNSRSNFTVIEQLLQLQQRWISKQSQIRQYVQSLKKTIEQKDMKIERMEIDNYKLVTKMSKIEKQKEHMTTKLSEIYQVVETMENQKLRKVVKDERNTDVDGKRKKQNKLMCQDMLVSQTYKPKSPKKQIKQQRNLHISSQEVNSTYYNYNQKQKQQSRTSTPPKQSPPHNNSTESHLEQRIMTNLVKMLEQNYYPHPHPHLNSKTESQISSDRISDDQAFVKKERDVRPTTTTAHTSGPQVRGTIVKRNSSKFKGERTPQKEEEKCQISCLTIEEETKREKEQKNKYKSAKTITFSNDQEPSYGLQDDQQNQFHSQNQIHSNAKNSLNSTPYQSAQITPQGSVKAIQSQNQSQAQSYVETVKRNQSILENMIKKEQGNMKLERVHEQLIKNEQIKKSHKLSVDKRQSLNSDDTFPQLIEQSRMKDVSRVQMNGKISNNVTNSAYSNTNNIHNNNINNTNNNNEQTNTRDCNRKKSRMNTKLTNLDYSMTSSFVSLSEIDGSQFRDNKLGEKLDLDYSDVVMVKEDQYEKENTKNQSYHEIGVKETRQHRNDHDHRANRTPSKDSKTGSKQSFSQNCQTQPKQSIIINNQQSQTNSMKKLLMASSSGSRFYYPQQKEIVTLSNLELQQWNIKNNVKIEQNQENKLKNTPNQRKLNQINQTNQAQYHNTQNTLQPTDSNLRKSSSKHSINNKTLNVQVQNNHRVNSQQAHPSNPQAMRSQKFHSPKFHSTTLDFNYTPLTKNLMNQKIVSNKFMNQQVNNRNSDDDKSTYQQLKKSPKHFSNSNDNFYIANHKRFDTFAQENTNVKKPLFDQGQFQCYTVSGKSNKSAPIQNYDHIHQPKQPFRQYTKERIPQTKSTSFKQHSNSFYLGKSASSDQPINNHSFKKLYKFTTESSQEPEYQQQQQQQHQQQRERSRKSSTQITPQLMVNFDKILFENSILKSYNTTLETKVKKMTKTEKLMEKFNEHNATVLNRIHKKSIS